MWEDTPSWRLIKTKADTNPSKLENKNSIPQHGERLPKTLAADKVTEWKQLRAGQNNTTNHKWSCHRKGGNKRPCQSLWRREHSFTLSWQSQRCQDPDTGCAPKHSYCWLWPMYDLMPDPPRAWRSAEKDEAEEGSRTWWNHKWNVETPRPWSKRIILCIYNQSWLTGTVPTIWTEAVIRHIPKKGKDKRDPSSYRPISLLSCAGKLLERIINKRLIWHLESNSVLAWTQTVYRQFRSTEDQLALLTLDIEDAFQEKKKILAVFFDLSKAFDKVWKEGLLLKLLWAGVHGKMYEWLSDFLFNRTARVKLDGMISRQVKLRGGVPQGGVVSPTLFLVYMNDITTTVPRLVSNTLHADDFAVWCAEEHTTTAVHCIQNTINEVCSWTESWALQLNTTKTVSTLFTLSTAKEKGSLKLNNQPGAGIARWQCLGSLSTASRVRSSSGEIFR